MREGDASPTELRIIGLRSELEIQPGQDLARVVLDSAARQDVSVESTDVLVVTQKVVSKAEGRLINLDDVEPSAFARQIAVPYGKDPRQTEVVLRESRRIVKMDRGILITETHHGLICANSGVDASNVDGGTTLCLLPLDPDASAAAIRARLKELAGVEPAVIITDTFGRAWRSGLTNVAIGVAGMKSIRSFAGRKDPFGYELRVTLLAVADELAGAAELVMGKTDGAPFAVVRGFPFEPAPGSAHELIRTPSEDLFR